MRRAGAAGASSWTPRRPIHRRHVSGRRHADRAGRGLNPPGTNSRPRRDERALDRDRATRGRTRFLTMCARRNPRLTRVFSSPDSGMNAKSLDAAGPLVFGAATVLGIFPPSRPIVSARSTVKDGMTIEVWRLLLLNLELLVRAGAITPVDFQALRPIPARRRAPGRARSACTRSARVVFSVVHVACMLGVRASALARHGTTRSASLDHVRAAAVPRPTSTGP